MQNTQKACFTSAVLLSACGPDVTLATVPSTDSGGDAATSAEGDTGESPGNEGVGETSRGDGTGTTDAGVEPVDGSGSSSDAPSDSGSSGGDAGTGESGATTDGPVPSFCERTDCDDGDPCTTDVCDDLALRCTYGPAVGAACDDGDACSVADVCQSDGTCAGEPTCPIEHCGEIATDETWGPELVHLLTCPVYVRGPTSPVLTILDGTTVLGDPYSELVIGYQGPGGLEIQGGAAGVVLTSSAAVPLPGDWTGITFGPSRTVASITGATIGFAGGFSAAIFAEGYGPVEQPDILVADTVIHDSAGHGIEFQLFGTIEIHDSTIVDNAGDGVSLSGARLAGTVPSFTGNTITGNGGAPLRVEADDVRHMDPSSSYAGNGERIHLSGSINHSATWHALDEDYTLMGSIGFSGGAALDDPPDGTIVLTVEAGATFYADAVNGGWIVVAQDVSDGARMVVQGTATDPVRFVGVRLEFTSVVPLPNPPSLLTHVIVEQGPWVGVWVSGGSLHVVDSEIRANQSGILGFFPNDLEISGTIVQDNDGVGIELAGPPTALLVDNTITGNGVAMRVSPTVPAWIDPSTTLQGNVADVVEISGSQATDDMTWPALEVPYRLGTVLRIGSVLASGATLTLEPGVTVLFEDAAGLWFGSPNPYTVGGPPWVSGLQANGTALQPITFASAEAPPAAGDWRGLLFDTAALPSTLQHCVVQHAGDMPTQGAIVVRADGVSVSDCTIVDTDAWGVYQQGATATLSGNTYANNSDGDVFP